MTVFTGLAESDDKRIILEGKKEGFSFQRINIFENDQRKYLIHILRASGEKSKFLPMLSFDSQEFSDAGSRHKVLDFRLEGPGGYVEFKGEVVGTGLPHEDADHPEIKTENIHIFLYSDVFVSGDPTWISRITLKGLK